MTGRTALLIAAVGVALAVPGNAGAVDHVTLFVSQTKLPQAGWNLSAAVVGLAAAGGRETFGISAHPVRSRTGVGKSCTASARRRPARSRSTAAAGAGGRGSDRSSRSTWP